MSRKTVTLPAVRATSELKNKVIQGCESMNLNYSTVVTCLLSGWVTGKIQLNLELDPDFIASAKEAFASDEVQKIIGELAESYNPDRTYADAVKA